LLECLDEHAIPALAVLARAEVVRVLVVDGRSMAPSGTNESMTRADEEACSSAFSSSGSKRTYSSLLISYPLTVSSRGTGPWIGHSRRIWIRDPHFAWSRWKATPCELVAVKSWTGMTARPREMSRFLIARGMVLCTKVSRGCGFHYSSMGRPSVTSPWALGQALFTGALHVLTASRPGRSIGHPTAQR
jgi:hypothetical protein